jgi:hypothetical protein
MHHSSRSRREPYVRGSERFEMKGSRGAMEETKTAQGTAPPLQLSPIKNERPKCPLSASYVG